MAYGPASGEQFCRVATYVVGKILWCTQCGCLRRSRAGNHVRAGGYDLHSEMWQLRRVTFGDARAVCDQSVVACRRRVPDGSLTIYVQADPPPEAQRANWLPAPVGDFSLFMRAYWPKVAVTRWLMDTTSELNTAAGSRALQ